MKNRRHSKIKFKHLAYSFVLGLILAIVYFILSFTIELIDFRISELIVIASIGAIFLYLNLSRDYQVKLKKHTYQRHNHNGDWHMPSNFTVKHIRLSKLLKRYRFQSHLFPEYFVSFIEGNRIYLRKNIKDSNKGSNYRIISVYNYDIALVEDEYSNKWVAHLSQLDMK